MPILAEMAILASKNLTTAQNKSNGDINLYWWYCINCEKLESDNLTWLNFYLNLS